MIKVAVIGVGHLGQHHARIYSEHPDVNLIGVVDCDVALSKKIASKFSTTPYKNIDELLLIDKPDMVSIVVPTNLHYEVALKCILNGIAVLIEKPVTSTVEQALCLRDLIQTHGVLVQVGHIEQFNGAFEKVKHYINQPLYIKCERLSPYNTRIADVGVVLDLLIHDVELVVSLIKSPVVDIRAWGNKIYGQHENIATLSLKFKNGLAADFLASNVSHLTTRKMEITDVNSYIIVDYSCQDLYVHRIIDKNGMLNETTEHPRFPKLEPLKKEIFSFVESFKKGAPPVVGIDSAIEALRICEQALKQIETM